MSELLLEAKNLEFSYTGKPFIRSVDIAAKRGKLSCIVGPNGAGKTTLVLLLAGIYKPLNGSIIFKGKELVSYARKNLARELAFIPSNVGAPFSYSVYEFIEMGRYAHAGAFAPMNDADRSAIDEALELTQLKGFEQQSINTLSSGEKQRAVIARSLAQKPICLLMDEPTAHLDLHYQIEIHKLLRNLADNCGLAVLFISHDLNLAASYSDEMILMNDGEIIRSGEPVKIMDQELLSEVYKVPLELIRHPRKETNFVWPKL